LILLFLLSRLARNVAQRGRILANRQNRKQKGNGRNQENSTHPWHEYLAELPLESNGVSEE
jgi:hypothetical protein